jgi:hypothetical protein
MKEFLRLWFSEASLFTKLRAEDGLFIIVRFYAALLYLAADPLD